MDSWDEVIDSSNREGGWHAVEIAFPAYLFHGYQLASSFLYITLIIYAEVTPPVDL